MIDKQTIQSAKEADLNNILDEFEWEVFEYGKIRCPHPDHEDKNPSCSYHGKNNKYKCFSCGRSFDAIDLYQCLAEKVNGRSVPFYRAVEEVLLLDGKPANSSNHSGNNHAYGSMKGNRGSGNSGQGNSPFDIVLSNSRPMTGYELNYLHDRGIMLYDAYVYEGKVHTAKRLEEALQKEADPQEIQKINDIKNKGTFYEGIAPILKKNRIQIKHNYWQGVNSILYLVDYDYYDDEELQDYALFLTDTERHMAVQKTLDGQHVKRALGTSDFIWIAEGIGDNSHTEDIYICEGMEDALTYTMHGKRSISLNSIENVKSLTAFLSKNYRAHPYERFVISLDHDNWGQRASQELIQFFEAYNQNTKRYKYQYAVCHYAEQYHDINDYWKAKVFPQTEKILPVF